MSLFVHPADPCKHLIAIAAVMLLVLLADVPALAQNNADPPFPLPELGLREVASEQKPDPSPKPPQELPKANPAKSDVPIVNREDTSITDKNIQQASCSSCGAGLLGPLRLGNGTFANDIAPSGHPKDRLFSDLCLNCGVGQCVPGREPCFPCCGDLSSPTHRFLCGLYQALCCPDPCYEGRWLPLTDSAFFVEAPRPVSQTRLRWDRGFHLILPDRSEYFWARADGNGRGPKPTPPAIAISSLNYNILSQYTEIATGRLGIIVETPYRSVNPREAPHAAGFGNMSIGTKTLLFDSELLLVSTIMRTYLPIGNASKGLGNGHVSLEPSLVFALKLNRDAYLQGQVAEWIPLGGDPNYAGAILHYHFSANRTLARILPDVPLIGTLECSGYSFQDGAYTDPVRGPYQQSSNGTYLYLAAGLRLFVCNRIDFGFSFSAPVTRQHFASQWYRTEFRFRY